MIKQCVICGCDFDARGSAKTCSVAHGKIMSKMGRAARHKKMYATNPEKHKAQAVRWRERNPEKVKAAAAAYRARTTEQRKEYDRRWREKNPDRWRELCRQGKRKADRRAALLEMNFQLNEIRRIPT